MAFWLVLLSLLATLTQLPVSGAAAARHVEIYELVPQVHAPPAVKARSVVLIDVDTSEVLFQRDANGRHAPASLTKVVTALVALDHLGLDQLVTVPTSINQLPWDSTRMGLHAGERLTVRNLLYGLFLNSGNDAAITLAEAAMPRSAFVGLMNAKAVSLGMVDTHFVNPVGLDDPAHYTSASDLATASLYLERQFPEVASLASTLAIEIPATPTHHAYHLFNLNQLLHTYPGTTGLKTGWTGQAGGCVIATATRDGRHLLLVVMGSPRVFDEATALLDYGFALDR